MKETVRRASVSLVNILIVPEEHLVQATDRHPRGLAKIGKLARESALNCTVASTGVGLADNPHRPPHEVLQDSYHGKRILVQVVPKRHRLEIPVTVCLRAFQV